MREELHYTDDATRAAERKAERGVQPFAESRGGAGEVGVGRCIADPARAAALEDAAGETLTRAERETLAERLELGCAVARVPGADAAKPIIGAGLPDGAELPAEHAADRLERGRVHLDRNVPFREDLGDLVLDALQALRVNGHRHEQH